MLSELEEELAELGQSQCTSSGSEQKIDLSLAVESVNERNVFPEFFGSVEQPEDNEEDNVKQRKLFNICKDVLIKSKECILDQISLYLIKILTK